LNFYKGTGGTPVNPCATFEEVNGLTDGTIYKCFPADGNSRVVFKVSDQSHELIFDGSVGTSFFDRISIETTSGTDYTGA
jgi:hypothetical protein